MIIATDYYLYKSKSDGRLRIINLESVLCPECGEKMRFIGTHKRILRHGDGTQDTMVLRRMFCDSCLTSHLELPDIVVPYKHYDLHTIMESVRELPSFAGETSTLFRWQHWLTELLDYVMTVRISSPKEVTESMVKDAIKELYSQGYRHALQLK